MLEPFLCNLKASQLKSGLLFPDSSEGTRYTSYANDVSVLVTSSVEVDEVSKEIGKYEVVTAAKINRERSIGLRLGSWKGCALPGPFFARDGICKILSVWFGPNVQLEKTGQKYWKRS